MAAAKQPSRPHPPDPGDEHSALASHSAKDQSSADEWEQLRALLLSDERAAIDALRRRLSDTDQRTADLAEVLPAALWCAGSDERLADALSGPIGQSLRLSAAREPGPLAETLKPAVGPALRRAIAEKLRHLARPAVWLPMALVALLAAGGIGWLWWQKQLWDARLQQARLRLESAPGILVVDWQHGRRPLARLLVDPLAGDPSALITDPEVLERLVLDPNPYLSADPEILIERTRRRLAVPDTVGLSLDAGELRLSGSAPADWIDRLSNPLALPEGIDSLDLSGLKPAASELMIRVRAAIEPPASVALHLENGDLAVTGEAPLDWIRGLPERLAGINGLGACDSTALAVAEVKRAETLRDALAGFELRFGDAVDPLPESIEAIDQAAGLLLELSELATHVDLELKVRILGNSDGVGDQRWNRWLRQQRADYVTRLLTERGVSSELLHAEPVAGYKPSAVARPADRWVRIQVEIQAPEVPGCPAS